VANKQADVANEGTYSDARDGKVVEVDEIRDGHRW